MNQEGCSSKNKKISNRIPAGSLVSLRNQKVSSLTTKRTSQAIRSNENEERESESRSLSFLRNQSLTTKRTFHENEERQSEAEKVSQRSQLQEKVRQVPLISTSSTAQGVQEQVRQVPMDSITPTSQAVHEPSEDSTNHEAIEQSEEPGPSAPKRKRGPTQMQSVHGRKDHKIIVLNEFDQPIGPTDEVVKELGSFLGTLGRNETFCPLTVFDWRKRLKPISRIEKS